MKKKFLVGIAAGMFAVATMVGFSMSNANGVGSVSLDDIAVMAQAQGESGGFLCCTSLSGTCDYGDFRCTGRFV